MRFLPLLRGGATAKFAAQAFLTSFNRRSLEINDLCLEHTTDFIMDCFVAINLKLTVTPDDVDNNFENFQWPIESMKIYTFKYSKTVFLPIETFLYEICIHQRKEEEIWFNTHKDEITENYMDEYLSPLQLLVMLISAWHTACQELLNPENSLYIKAYFEEPVARINFQLLRGVTYLRQFYRLKLPILDKACDSLLETAQLGIMYPESHLDILRGLLKLFNEHFHLFYEFSETSVKFYYNVLASECPKSSHQLIYESFIDLLRKYGINHIEINSENANTIAQQRSLTVTNYIVGPDMLNAYYHSLVKKPNKKVTYAVLEFLYVLQSKLISRDCFSVVFVEGILNAVLSNDSSIGYKAAKLYITMTQNRSDVESTIEHIIGYYFSQMNTTELLSLYLSRFWKYYKPLQNIDYYAVTFQQCSVEAEAARIMSAHVVVVIFNLLLEHYDVNEAIVVGFLQKLMNILKNIKCETTQGILLDVFETICKTKKVNEMTVSRETFSSFEERAQKLFVSLENLQYPLLTKWFLIWESLSFETDINDSTQAIISQYNVFRGKKQNSLKNFKRNDVLKYRILVQRLCLLTQSNNCTLDSESVILKDMREGLMQFEPERNGVFYEYAFKFMDFVDVYALELYTISLIKIFNSMPSTRNRIEHTSLESKVQEFEKHLSAWIRNIELINEQPFVRVKTIFICFLELHLAFSSDSNYRILKLSVETYEILVRVLTHITITSKEPKRAFNEYEEDEQVHPLRTLSYQRLLIERFANFHKCYGDQLNSHYVWHFCLYYSLPQSRLFKNELNEFMLILAQHCFPIFRHILPIIIFNLYTLQPALKNQTVFKAIIAHNTFIDNLPSTLDRAWLKVHILISVIDLVHKSLPARSFDKSGDRLASLQHLHKFVENLDLNAGRGQLPKDIRERTNLLRQHYLRKTELKTLENFLNHFCLKE